MLDKLHPRRRLLIHTHLSSEGVVHSLRAAIGKGMFLTVGFGIAQVALRGAYGPRSFRVAPLYTLWVAVLSWFDPVPSVELRGELATTETGTKIDVHMWMHKWARVRLACWLAFGLCFSAWHFASGSLQMGVMALLVLPFMILMNWLMFTFEAHKAETLLRGVFGPEDDGRTRGGG